MNGMKILMSDYRYEYQATAIEQSKSRTNLTKTRKMKSNEKQNAKHDSRVCGVRCATCGVRSVGCDDVHG